MIVVNHDEGTVKSIEIVPRGGQPLKMGGPPLDFINIQPPKRGSASRIHQHTAPLAISELHMSQGWTFLRA